MNNFLKMFSSVNQELGGPEHCMIRNKIGEAYFLSFKKIFTKAALQCTYNQKYAFSSRQHKIQSKYLRTELRHWLLKPKFIALPFDEIHHSFDTWPHFKRLGAFLMKRILHSMTQLPKIMKMSSLNFMGVWNSHPDDSLVQTTSDFSMHHSSTTEHAKLPSHRLSNRGPVVLINLIPK